MKEIIKYVEITSTSINDQLKFYKEHFELFGCERCDNKLHWGWVIYDDTYYCETCFEIKHNEDIEQAKQTVKNFEELIEQTKLNYPDIEWSNK